MPGLVPGHPRPCLMRWQAWMAGTSPAMTDKRGESGMGKAGADGQQAVGISGSIAAATFTGRRRARRPDGTLNRAISSCRKIPRDYRDAAVQGIRDLLGPRPRAEPIPARPRVGRPVKMGHEPSPPTRLLESAKRATARCWSSRRVFPRRAAHRLSGAPEDRFRQADHQAPRLPCSSGGDRGSPSVWRADGTVRAGARTLVAVALRASKRRWKTASRRVADRCSCTRTAIIRRA